MNIEFLDLDKITIDKDHLFNVRQNLEFNKSVLKHYRRLLFSSRYYSNSSFRKSAENREDFNPDSLVKNKKYVEKVLTMENKLANMSSCNSLWLLNVYDSLKIKDFIKTNLCKDRFCANCKKVKQASRMARFIPEIKKYKDYPLYHLTLTVPNVSGDCLRFAVDCMFKAFTRLTHYLKLKEKISGIDFSKYNYLGAIRSFEVTYKKGSFHPHIHCLLVLDYELEEGNIVNKFSKSFGKVARKFSETEILFQKLWRLLVLFEYKKRLSVDKELIVEPWEKDFNDSPFETINKRTISKMSLGFNTHLEKFEENHYFELFKYMTKAQNEYGENSSFDDFLHLYFQLKSVRQIQGYGCFFRIKDEDLEDVTDLNYDTLESIWQSIESPRVSTEKIEDLYLDNEYKLYSRKKITPYLREINRKEIEKEKEGGQPSLKNG